MSEARLSECDEAGFHFSICDCVCAFSTVAREIKRKTSLHSLLTAVYRTENECRRVYTQSVCSVVCKEEPELLKVFRPK